MVMKEAAGSVAADESLWHVFALLGTILAVVALVLALVAVVIASRRGAPAGPVPSSPPPGWGPGQPAQYAPVPGQPIQYGPVPGQPIQYSPVPEQPAQYVPGQGQPPQ
ncbi:hypothetical protein F0L68_22715 [Solihabitans fulvus]|uniref:Uncharacterized protein n=1 Tax=Solihabitans fulvus TaxID=1892852 RepID=A0A5B2X636_9PSEU|nr:hypothetical protein F0L68_22715 [Solihabitans fulvus]